MISSSAWATKWYITLFVNTVPFAQQLRLWDALWLDGRDVMILTSIAILWSFRGTLGFLVSQLTDSFVVEDDDDFMRWVRKMINQPGMRKKIGSWRKEWLKLVEEGRSEGVLL